VKWFQKAAEQNVPQAMRHLGLCYLHGVGIAENVSEAIDWLKKAGEHGDAVALRELGLMCRVGEHLDKDDELAEKLLLEAEGV
jgi:TPR repeat protein